MIKKIIFVLSFLLLSSPVFAGQIDRYFTYGQKSEVNYLNLNHNFDNILNEINGSLDNTNMKTGFRLVEILGELPVAGNEGRVVYLTTSNTMHFDDGSAWVEVPTYSGSGIQGDIIYFNGSVWARLPAGTAGDILKTGGGGANPSWLTILPIENGGTGNTTGNPSGTAGGDLTGTYPNPTINASILPAFLVKPTTDQEDIAPTGGITVIFGTEIFDNLDNFASNTFTAPVTGKYLLSCSLHLLNLDNAATLYTLQIVTSNRTYTIQFDPSKFSADITDWSFTLCVVADMDIDDTAFVKIEQTIGATQADIEADNTWFSGHLVH